MSTFKLLSMGIGAALFITACNKEPSIARQSSPAPSPGASPTPDPFAAARSIFTKDCAVCHGDTGEGKTATIEGKRIKAPSLRTGHALHHPDSDFVKQITKGGDGMPAFGQKLSPEQINDLVRFIRHEFQGKS